MPSFSKLGFSMPTAESFQPERLQAALRPALASAEADQGLQAYRAFYGLPEGCEHRLGRLSQGGYELVCSCGYRRSPAPR